MKSTTRRARVGVLIATGIIGFGGVAAAGPGGVFDSGDETDEVATTTTTTEAIPESATTVAVSVEVTTTVAETLPEQVTTTVATPEEAPAGVAEVLSVEREGEAVLGTDDPDTLFDETNCLEGNHGKTVSAVARGELVIPGSDVGDAAHSSCGKQEAVAEPEEAVEPEETVDEPVEATKGQGSAKEKKPGNGNGHGQGKGNDKGG